MNQVTFAGFDAEANKSLVLARARAKKAQMAKDMKAVNAVLYALGHNVYHESVPLDTICTALTDNGFESLEPMLLCGERGFLHEAVGRDKWLALSWYKMESGKYEVVAYVS